MEAVESVVVATEEVEMVVDPAAGRGAEGRAEEPVGARAVGARAAVAKVQRQVGKVKERAGPVEMEDAKAARAMEAKQGLAGRCTPRRLVGPRVRDSPRDMRLDTGWPSTMSFRSGTECHARHSKHHSQQSLCRQRIRMYHQGEAHHLASRQRAS